MPIDATKKGTGASRISARLQVLGDMRPTFARVTLPFVVEHVQKNVASLGVYGGDQRWSFDDEPLFQARKVAIFGERIGTRPLYAGDQAVVIPGITTASNYVVTKDGVSVKPPAPYAARLFFTGGVGPLGEPYKPRNPYRMTPEQVRRLRRLEQQDVQQRIERLIS